ncbi:MAG: AMP-binding protein [Acidobacteriaceae bacterium]
MDTFNDVKTLIELLDRRMDESGEKTAFTFIGSPCSFQDLWRGINRFASFLLEKGVTPGERVVVALPNGEDFFYAFYGIQRAGAIAVPLFPESDIPRVASIARMCGARLAVLPAKIPPLEDLESITVSESNNSAFHLDFPRVGAGDIAFIQYTSGSTGNPKGVQLTHFNLLTNIRQMIQGMQITARDIFVSWLPVHHDMGLILNTMVPFYLAAELHLLPSDLRSVQAWLQTIHERRGTFTAAPDFAYRYCLRHLDNLGDYDLRSLRVALNAAEPVRAETIRAFEAAFGLTDIMLAGYGLAEATVGVSMWLPRTPPLVDRRGFVSVGPPFPGVDVRILKDGRVAREGEVGEILVKSAANTCGYFNNPAETASLFTRDGYLHTGDLGYLDSEGHLFIVGRKKNIIKHAGETISPQEIEETVDALPGVRFSAAVGIDRGGFEGEQAFVFVEVPQRELSEDDCYELIMRIVQAIHRRLGFHPGRVLLVAPRAIPRTSNGKIQHLRLRDLYLDGVLKDDGLIVYPDL